MKLRKLVVAVALTFPLVIDASAQTTPNQAPPAAATAASTGELDALRETTLQLIRLLVQEGVLTRQRAEELIVQANERARAVREQSPIPRAAIEAPAEDGRPGRRKPAAETVRVPFVPESVKNEIRQQLKEEIIALARTERWAEPNAIPEWLDRIQVEGDIRVRGQSDRFDSSNAPQSIYPYLAGTPARPGAPIVGAFPDPLINETDRNRLTIRARLSVLARISPQWSTGFRVATGSLNSAVSTTQTLGGNNGYLTRTGIVLDRAFIRWDPVETVSAWAGRMSNPWFSTDLAFAEELGFDGLAANYRPKFGTSTSGFFTAGAFPVQEFSTSGRDRWLYGMQAGVETQWGSATRFRAGLALYDYRRLEGRPAATGDRLNDINYGFSQYPAAVRSRGNTLVNVGDPATPDLIWGLASKFRPVALTAVLDLAQFDPVHVIVSGEYIRNIGFDQNEIRDRTGNNVNKENAAYQMRVMVGQPTMRNRWDWQTFVGYRRLERDAIPDVFADPNFHLGGTNYKGYTIGGQLGLDRNVWLGLRWLSTDRVSGPPRSIDVLQLDLNARF